MGKLAWLTDTHFDFLDEVTLDGFVDHVVGHGADGLVLSGDIADSETLIPVLEKFDAKMTKPVWFVMGNHDYYRTSVSEMRGRIRSWSQGSVRTKWLPDVGCIPLSETTILVGHGGWGDGGYGSFMTSSVMLNDYRYIRELVCSTKAELHGRLRELGVDAANAVEALLERAFETHDNAILVTHVPPFVEACWHEGVATLNEWTPHFTCMAVGERLLSIMERHGNKSLHVVCGHTHSGGMARMRDNLVVVTGGATYGSPALQLPISYT